jgi:hypothetical protein
MRGVPGIPVGVTDEVVADGEMARAVPDLGRAAGRPPRTSSPQTFNRVSRRPQALRSTPTKGELTIDDG